MRLAESPPGTRLEGCPLGSSRGEEGGGDEGCWFGPEKSMVLPVSASGSWETRTMVMTSSDYEESRLNRERCLVSAKDGG